MDKNLLLKINDQSIGLDVGGGELNYISHAHSDHAYPLKYSAPYFCSDETFDLLNHNPSDKGIQTSLSKRKTKKKIRAERSKTPSSFNLISAGHIFGSTQLQIKDTPEFGDLVYTGDFKLQDGLTTKGAPILDCDTLILESTYGDPKISFPDPQDVYSDMEKWARVNKDHIQLWGGYATGKAQELIRFLNDYLDETPIVSKKISQVCSAYEKNGVRLDWIEAGSMEAKEMMRSSFSAVFAPHQLTNSFAYSLARTHRRQAHIALATGWTGLRPLSCSVSFPLSDHADFSQILDYCQGSDARQVYIAHGKNSETAKELQKLKINAKPIDKIEILKK